MNPLRNLRSFAFWSLPYVALLLLVLWGRTQDSGFLWATGAITILAAVTWMRKTPVPSGYHRVCVCWVLLLLALMAAGVTAWRLHYITTNWQRVVSARESRAVQELDERFRELMAQGEDVAGRAARLAETMDAEALLPELVRLRTPSVVSAVAVVDSMGELEAWVGEHRGRLPAAVRALSEGVVYNDGPLFSHVYIAKPIQDGRGHAFSAVLLQAGLGLREGEVHGFADQFAAETGVRPHFGAGPALNAVWELIHVGEVLAHATLEMPGQAEWRAAVERNGRRVVLALLGIGLVVIGSAWLAAGLPPSPSRALPLLAALPPLALAPLGDVLGVERAFSPALFLLPGMDLSLGRLVALLLPIAALVSTVPFRSTVTQRPGLRLLLGAGVASLALVVFVQVFMRDASAPLLESESHLWGGFLAACLLSLSVVFVLAISALNGGEHAGVASNGRMEWLRRYPLALILSGLTVGSGLALAIVVWGGADISAHPALPLLWALPFVPLALGLSAYTGRGRRCICWLAAGWLAFTGVAPQLWVAQLDARMAAAERELETLGARPDPFLEYLLWRFAHEVRRNDERGERGRELLYGAWLASGLAREAYPARITLWRSDAMPAHEIALAGAAESVPLWDAPPHFLVPSLRRAGDRNEPLVETVEEVPGVNKILAVPLTGDRAVSVVIPPRRSLDGTTVLGPFFGIERRPHIKLTLVRAVSDHEGLGEPTERRRTDQGWRTERLVSYPDGDYHASLDLRLPPKGVRLARGALLLAVSLAVLGLVWVTGQTARGEPPRPPGGWISWLQSFRARITLALFVFFLAPCILFGWAAYRAAAGEVARTARIVAERAASQAVASFPAAAGNLHTLSAHTGEEILYYFRGELANASSPVVFEMGLFGSWMSPAAYQALTSGQEHSVVETLDLAGRPYMVAYKRLSAAGVLGVPVWLAAGEAAVRQREMAHLVLFAALMGGLLSLGLSVVVGKTLARPISRMRSAAGMVGAGQLRVQLPEGRGDEFGELFAAFNTMVRRLRDARFKELRTARVLAWGEVARQVAHEIKNPLTPVKLSVQHLQRAYLDERSDYREILDINVKHILSEIERLTEISRVFMRFAAPAAAAGPLEAVDVGAVVREALTLYQASDPAVNYREEIEPDLPLGAARPGEVKEVVLNLLENARTAVEGEGNIQLGVSCNDGMLELVVRDDGVGISQELLQRIFEPHFSTRSSGTGLGLAIVRLLVESWGGSVSAESEPGQGATLRVRIPLADSANVSDK